MQMTKVELARSITVHLRRRNEVAIGQIREVLSRHRGSITACARELGVSRVTMTKWAGLVPGASSYRKARSPRERTPSPRAEQQSRTAQLSHLIWRRDPATVTALREAFLRHRGRASHVASEYGVGVATVIRWADTLGIPRRSHRDAAKNLQKEY